MSGVGVAVSATADRHKLDIVWEQVGVEGEELAFRAVVTVKTRLPAQNEGLADGVEQVCEDSGQEFKRALFRQIMERADLEVVVAQRAGKKGQGLKRIGRKRYTFKTVFGCVPIQRIRIKHRADGTTEIPSHKVWKTPRNAMTTRGLQAAVFNTAVKESYRNTVSAIERRSGVTKLVSKSTVQNILHAAGKNLADANESRARQELTIESGSKALLGEWNIHVGENYFGAHWLDDEDWEYASTEEIAGLYEQLERETKELIAESLQVQPENPSINGESPVNELAATIAGATETASPSESASNLIIVQVDENLVHSQISEDRKYVVNYSGVVTTTQRDYYFSANTSAQLIWQVNGLLTVLGVHRADNNIKLLLLNDGAGWIRNWYRSIEIANKQTILCWFHLNKRCWRLIREAVTDKEMRIEVKKTLQQYLWRGQVTQAKGYLKTIANNSDDGIGTIKINNDKAWTTLMRYLGLHESEILNYCARWKKSQPIASTRVEKFNDTSVSVRCKRRGLRWTGGGVGAIAAWETATRNGEMANWQRTGELASWREISRQVA